MEGVSVGSCRRVLKGEDFAVNDVRKERAVIGVFDSHGGAEAGRLCHSTLTERLLGGEVPFERKEIVDHFWEMDHQLGADGVMSGTTATLLMVSRAKSATSKAGSQSVPCEQQAVDTEGSYGETKDAVKPAALHCTLAWVGDSRGLLVDMTSPHPTPQIGCTTLHTPDNEAEVERCWLEWSVRRQLKAMSDDSTHAGQALAHRDHADESSFTLVARRALLPHHGPSLRDSFLIAPDSSRPTVQGR